MKRCFKCGEEKAEDAFYKHPMMADGLLGKCKECAKRDVRLNRMLRLQYYAEYERDRFLRPERKAQAAASQKRRRILHPEKTYAHNAVYNAIRDGRLIRRPCEVCGNLKSQAHHDDYGKPLIVRWLCFVHHRIAHGQNPMASNPPDSI